MPLVNATDLVTPLSYRQRTKRACPDLLLGAPRPSRLLAAVLELMRANRTERTSGWVDNASGKAHAGERIHSYDTRLTTHNLRPIRGVQTTQARHAGDCDKVQQPAEQSFTFAKRAVFVAHASKRRDAFDTSCETYGRC